jgi:hypothetical protein
MQKVKWDRGNPTDHAVIFLAVGIEKRIYEVYCFVDGNGI